MIFPTGLNDLSDDFDYTLPGWCNNNGTNNNAVNVVENVVRKKFLFFQNTV